MPETLSEFYAKSHRQPMLDRIKSRILAIAADLAELTAWQAGNLSFTIRESIGGVRSATMGQDQFNVLDD